MIPKPSEAEAIAEVSGLAVPVAAAVPVDWAASVPVFLVVELGQVRAVDSSCSLHWPLPHCSLLGGPHRWKRITLVKRDTFLVLRWRRCLCTVCVTDPFVRAGLGCLVARFVKCHGLPPMV